MTKQNSTTPESASVLGFIRASRSGRFENTELLANIVACVLDETLLHRIGEFSWEDSIVGATAFDHVVPTNRWERAACHFWDTIFATEIEEIGNGDMTRLMFLVDDIEKAAMRCGGGNIKTKINESVWHKLSEALRGNQ